jgi:hypothetical protein
MDEARVWRQLIAMNEKLDKIIILLRALLREKTNPIMTMEEVKALPQDPLPPTNS